MRSVLKAPEIPDFKDEHWKEKLLRLTGFEVDKCPKCKLNTLEMFSKIKGVLT